MRRQNINDNIQNKKHIKLHISSIINPIIKTFQDRYGNDVEDLHQNWINIVGKEYSNISKPLKIMKELTIQSGKKHTIRKLYIEASGPRSLELNYKKNELIGKVNQIYGKNFISNVIIKQKYQINKTEDTNHKSINQNPIGDKYNTEVQGVKKEDLKLALAKLGSFIGKNEEINED